VNNIKAQSYLLLQPDLMPSMIPSKFLDEPYFSEN